MSGQPVRVELHDKVEYRLNGILHRLDGPAVKWANGDKSWYVYGKLHRLDGPAVKYVNGTKEWYIDGKRHRLDGPASEYGNGDKEWWVDGKRHRMDGPAIEWANGRKRWYINGKDGWKTALDNRRLKILTLSFVVNRRIWKSFVPNVS